MTRPTPSADQRDALVRALITPRAGKAPVHVTRVDDAVAALHLPDLDEALLVVDGSSPRLRLTLATEIRRRRPGTTHLAVVGGHMSVRKLLRSQRPLWSFDRRLVVHHVDGASVWSAGGRLPRLLEAAEAVALVGEPSHLPLSAEEIEASRARLRDAQAETIRLHALLAARWPVATWSLLVLFVGVFALELAWGGAQSVSTLWRMGANDPERVALGEPWRLLASTLLHTGPLHLAVNLFATWSLGSVLERYLGTRRFIVLWGTGALGGSIASAVMNDARISVGASGALFAMVAGLWVLSWRRPDLLPRSSRAVMRRQLTAPVLLVLVASLSKGSDLFAHLGGALTGVVLLAWPSFTRSVRPPEEQVEPERWDQSLELTAAAAALTVALLTSFFAALASGRPWELAAPPLIQQVALGDSGLSITVPRRMVRHSPERNGQSMRWTFGEPLRDPMTVEVWVSPQTGEPLEQAYELMKDAIPAGDAGPAVMLEYSGGKPIVRLDRRERDGAHVREWITDRGDWRVVVRALAVEHVPLGWAMARDALVRSLHDDAQTR